jgi:hypothetical protein
MKLFISFTLLIFSTCIKAQVDSLPLFYIADGNLNFKFDIRSYQGDFKKDFTKCFDTNNKALLSQLDNQEIWNSMGWTMKKVNAFTIEVSKPFDQFDTEFPWTSKYKIDGFFWKGPVSTPLTSFDSIYQNGKYILNPNGEKVQESQMVTFNLDGYKRASNVILSGSFNNWNESELRMKKEDSKWSFQLNLPPGIYEYKFIVDGNWTHDKRNPITVKNQHETLNSILVVGRDRQFQLPGFANARKVYLSGSFNNWHEKAIPMVRENDAWKVDIALPKGKHYYKFIVDGDWIIDPLNDLTQYDSNGYENSVLILSN